MPKDLMKYECLRCGWIYDPAEGDPDSGIKPGTPFKDIPNSWKCLVTESQISSIMRPSAFTNVSGKRITTA